MKKITFLLALTVSTLTFGQELFTNGGFENWDDTTTPSGFSIVEAIEQESSEVHSGSFSAKHTGGRNDLRQVISVTPGNSYTLGLWYKVAADTGDGNDFRIWSYWRSNSGNISGLDDDSKLRGPNNSYFDNNGNVWTEYETTIIAPSDATEFYYEIRTYSGAVVYLDDFSFVDNGTTLSIAENTIDGLIVSSANGTISTNKGEIATVYNVLGQKVSNQNLTSGIYVVIVKEGSTTVSEKIYVK